MLPVLQVGPLAIPVPAFSLLVGLWVALTLAERFAPRFGMVAAHLYNLAFVMLLAALAGARLGYVLRYPDAFVASPLSVFSRDVGLLDPLGAAAGALIAGLAYGQRKNLPFWATLDALTPGLAVLSVALGFAYLASGSAFGTPTTLSWGIKLWGAQRHPTQVYEIVLSLIVLAAIWPGRGVVRTDVPGRLFLAFLAMSAGWRLFLEGLRGDSLLIAGGIRAAQIIFWLALVASLWALGKLHRQAPQEEIKVT